MPNISRRIFLAQAGGLTMVSFIRKHPELILHNCDIITIDPTQPRAQAMAIANNHLLAVGSNSDIMAMKGPLTKTMDLGGKTVVPGFIDSHSHPGSAGRRHLVDIDCELPSIAKIKEAVKVKAASTKPGEWVFGFKYDDTKTKEGRYLTREYIDEAAPNHPVQITHRGGHTSFVNSLALKRAGVNESTPDPPGGHFDRCG